MLINGGKAKDRLLDESDRRLQLARLLNDEGQKITHEHVLDLATGSLRPLSEVIDDVLQKVDHCVAPETMQSVHDRSNKH